MTVYIIKIIFACENCWYKNLVGKQVELKCVKSTFQPTPFSSPREVFKVLTGSFSSVKYVDINHAHIVGERKANKQELYGGSREKPSRRGPGGKRNGGDGGDWGWWDGGVGGRGGGG